MDAPVATGSGRHDAISAGRGGKQAGATLRLGAGRDRLGTSIDSMAVGVGLAFVDVDIIPVAAASGLATSADAP